MIRSKIERLVGMDFMAVFPSGWEARPWDNIYSIRSIAEQNHRIKIDLGDKWIIEFDSDGDGILISSSLVAIVNNFDIYADNMHKHQQSGVFAFITPDIRSQEKIYSVYEKINELIYKI